MKALIAAGGRGTRLYPITFTSNKHLIPVANKPLLLYPVEAIAAAGIKEVGVIVNETRPAIESLLGDGSAWGFKITYIFQEKPEGLGHCVKVAEEFMAGSPFVFHLGDNIFTDGIGKPFDHFLKTKPDALLTITKHEENWRLGVPFFDDQGKLVKVVEKPKNPPNPYGVPGLYFFNRHVFEAFRGKDRVKKSARGEYEITDLYTYLLEHGYRVEYEEVGGWWRDPGKMEDLLEANSLILDKFNEHRIEGKVDKETQISGDVTIEKGSTVTRSVIRGPVVIGRNVVIEDSYVGPFTSIYHECLIKNCEVENSVLLQGARLENLDKRVDKSLIGNKAQVIRTDTRPRSYNFLVGDMSRVDLF
jgi:glucose-1-phosphate thymidylyltransferase